MKRQRIEGSRWKTSKEREEGKKIMNGKQIHEGLFFFSSFFLFLSDTLLNFLFVLFNVFSVVSFVFLYCFFLSCFLFAFLSFGFHLSVSDHQLYFETTFSSIFSLKFKFQTIYSESERRKNLDKFLWSNVVKYLLWPWCYSCWSGTQ